MKFKNSRLHVRELKVTVGGRTSTTWATNLLVPKPVEVPHNW